MGSPLRALYARRVPSHSARISPCHPRDENDTTSVRARAGWLVPVALHASLALCTGCVRKRGACPSAACHTRPRLAAARWLPLNLLAAARQRKPSPTCWLGGKPSGERIGGPRCSSMRVMSAVTTRWSSSIENGSDRPLDVAWQRLLTAASAARRASRNEGLVSATSN